MDIFLAILLGFVYGLLQWALIIYTFYKLFVYMNKQKEFSKNVKRRKIIYLAVLFTFKLVLLFSILYVLVKIMHLIPLFFILGLTISLIGMILLIYLGVLNKIFSKESMS